MAKIMRLLKNEFFIEKQRKQIQCPEAILVVERRQDVILRTLVFA